MSDISAPKKCDFCYEKLTKRHLCNGLFTYMILRKLFLSLYYETQPKALHQLLKTSLDYIDNNKMFADSMNITTVIEKHINTFSTEFDLF